MGANMERDMRQQLFDHYEKLSFSYYDQNNSGQMMSKLVSDLFDISEFAHHGPENLFISLIKIIGSFIFLFLINWRLAIPLLVLVVFMLFFSYGRIRRCRRHSWTTGVRSGMLIRVFRIHWPGSVLYSPLQMKRLNGRSSEKATRDFCVPRMPIINVWEAL